MERKRWETRGWVVAAFFAFLALFTACGDDTPADPADDLQALSSEQQAGAKGGAALALPDLGTATAYPREVEAGSQARFVVQYTVGTPIEIGGGLSFTFGTSYAALSQCPINPDPNAPCGAVRVVSSNDNVLLMVQARFGGPNAGLKLSHADLLVQNARLETGDTVTVVYGATEGLAFAQEIAQNLELTVLVQPAPDGALREIAESPVIQVRPRGAHKLVSAVNLSEHRLRLSVVDRYANLVDDFYGLADIYAINETYDETSVGQALIRRGTGAIALPSLPDGYYVLRAELPGAELESLVPYAPGRQKTFFGDLHSHTKFSDAYVAADPIDAYTYARKTALLDFAAVSDHAEYMIQNTQLTRYLAREGFPNSWQEMQRVTNRYNGVGFTTLVGFETTTFGDPHPRPGHMNLYYRGDRGQLYTYSELVPNVPYFYTHDELWDMIDQSGQQALAIPHHTLYSGNMGSDFVYYDPRHMRLVEIYSEHGCSESTECANSLFEVGGTPDANGAVQRAIGPLGYRMGFTASSDSHVGHPAGTGIQDPVLRNGLAGGLTAVLANEMNRESLWTALYDRAVYATTGERIYVEFAVNGRHMGAETVAADAPTEITARVIGTDVILSTEVWKYTGADGWQVFYSDLPDGLFWNTVVADESVDHGAVYYLKVTQADGAMAWSSPVWVDAAY
jgi:hypothetical protein